MSSRSEAPAIVADTQPLLAYIRREFLFDETAHIADDQELVPDVVDSLGIVDLVDFIELTYSIEIAEDDLLFDNFRTLRSIAALIDRLEG
jgi:acyl carrier protein